jgi:hypothetical protein
MSRKPNPQPDNPEQFKRFIEIAREIGAEADPETVDRVLDKVARSPKPRPGQAGSAPGSKKIRDRSP